jgi:phosphomannomutase/phosphoglucomutase
MKLRKSLDGTRATLIALLVAVAVAGALLLNLVLAHAWSVESATRSARASAIAAQVARALDAYARLLQAQALQISASPAVRDALATGSVEALEAAQQDIVREFPALDSARLLVLGQLGIAAPGFSPESLHNNVEVNLVGRSFNGEATTAETIATDSGWLLTVAARIDPAANTNSGGVLLLRARLDTLFDRFLLPGTPEGEYSLRADLRPTTDKPVASGGATAAAGSELALAATSVAHLNAGFRPGEDFIEASAVSGNSLLLPIAGGILGLLGLLVFGFRQLQRQLREDGERLANLALYQRAATATVPPLHFGELAPLGAALVKLRQDMHTSSRRPREESPRAEPRPAEDALEIEVLEESPGEDIRFEEQGALAVPEEVFREYDIRGLSTQLSRELCLAIGQAVAAEVLERGFASIVVGADGRDSSPALREQLVRGLIGSGVDVIDVGTVATPMLYFACHHLGTQTGVMVTGSHNGAEHNGFKIMIGGETLCGERITALRERILAGSFREGQGSYRVTEINADYLRAVCDDVLVDGPLKVVVDCGNGAASVVAVELLQQLGCEVHALFCELDSRFPNHAPDPSVPSNLRQLLSEVAARRADLGVAFDGDADRIGVVSSSGRIVAADRLLMLFSRELLSRRPGADIVFDVKCSRDLPGVITAAGGRPIMWRSGHSWIKQKMRETDALLGGEYTGHICFRDRWHGFDDALYCAARLLELICAEKRPLDELLAELPRSVSTPEILITVPAAQKFELMQRVDQGINLEGARLIRLDGVRAEFRNGWGLVRASNTTAALSCRFEGADERALELIQGKFRDELRRLLPDIKAPV